MGYVWYADIFFATVWLIDTCALLVMTWLFDRSKRIRRCLLLAALSALVETAGFRLFSSYLLYQMFVLFACNPLLVWACLFPAKKREVAGGYVVSSAFLLLLGGLQMVFLVQVPLKRGIWIWQIGLAGVIAVGCVFARRMRRSRAYQYEVELVFGDQHIWVKACHDTGNYLRDPFTGKPVHVLDGACWTEELKEMYPRRLIPYHTVGRPDGRMWVATIDRMILRQGDKTIEKIQPVIGCAQEPVFLKGEIQMILHNEII